jgi:hypothetical protein
MIPSVIAVTFVSIVTYIASIIIAVTFVSIVTYIASIINVAWEE